MSRKTRDVMARTVPCEIEIEQSRPDVPRRVTATEGIFENDFPAPRRGFEYCYALYKDWQTGKMASPMKTKDGVSL